MSVIIEFPANAAVRPASGPAAGRGEVIIFPGVRVERREYNLADRMANVRRRPSSPNQAEDFKL